MDDKLKQDEQREALKKQQKKSKLEQQAALGVQGGLELKKDEKAKFLGQFKERVLKALTFAEVEKKGIYPEVAEAIEDKRADKLIIDRRVDKQAAKEYINLSREADLSFKRVQSPDFVGDIGLVVASNQAVKVDNILLNSSKQDEAILPESLLAAKGKKICADCYNKLKDIAPDKVSDYKKISIIDKLLGVECAAEINQEVKD